MSNIVSIARQILVVRPNMTRRDALSLARLPRARYFELRARNLNLFSARNVASTLRTLRALGEVK